MGVAGGAKGGYSRRNSRRESRHGAMSEINVTPLVDVMLVLLIVFMVAAPLMTVGVPIELPKTEASSQLNTPTEPLTISLQADRSLYLQETKIELADLAAKLLAIAKNGTDVQVVFNGDKSVSYGAAMEVLGVLNSAGYRKITLATTTKDVAAPGN